MATPLIFPLGPLAFVILPSYLCQVFGSYSIGLGVSRRIAPGFVQEFPLTALLLQPGRVIRFLCVLVRLGLGRHRLVKRRPESLSGGGSHIRPGVDQSPTGLAGIPDRAVALRPAVLARKTPQARAAWYPRR